MGIWTVHVPIWNACVSNRPSQTGALELAGIHALRKILINCKESSLNDLRSELRTDESEFIGAPAWLLRIIVQ